MEKRFFLLVTMKTDQLANFIFSAGALESIHLRVSVRRSSEIQNKRDILIVGCPI